MIAAWMMFGLISGMLIAVGSALLDRGARAASLPSRAVWLAGLTGLAVSMALAPLRRGAPLQLPGATVVAASVAPGSAAPATELLASVRGMVSAVMLAPALRGRAEPLLGVAWLILTAAVIAVGLTTLARAHRARRAWPVRTLGGAAVRVAPAAGPVVIGLRRPEVVVPAWLLHAEPETQRLVLMHEMEHVRARDPLVLAVGAGLAALMPWNPAGWWMLMRLRAAVEVDCDRRVLRRGVRPAEYASVLITTAGRAPALILGAPAMAGPARTLERRLKAMTRPLSRFGALRGSAFAALALGAFAAACDTRLPTEAELSAMNVSAAESRARPMLSGPASYFIDERAATAAEAHALTPEQIAQIEVRKEAQSQEIRIITVAYADAHHLRRPARPGEQVRVEVDGNGPSQPRTDLGSFAGLILIDGVVSTPSRLQALDPSRIVSMEVLKGEGAAAQYDDPRAQHGVIRVTTRQR
jgi:beta-lactamase regulating signal transducer with metallopeptidase domain